jgi:transcriptional regulator with XRE-family HTH domain
MSRQGMKVRTLARRLAGGQSATIERVEVERRAVRRWLNGAKPSQVNRRRVAVALGLPEDTFDDEDEEDDLPSFLAKEAGRTARRVAAFLAKTPVPPANTRRRRTAPTPGG